MRLRVKFQRKFSLENLFLTVAMFCVVTYALLEHVSISVPLYSPLKMPILYLGGICVLSQIRLLIKTFMKKKYFYIWLTVLAMCGLLFLSAYSNRDPEVGVFPLRPTFRVVLYIIELFALMIWVAEKGCGRRLLRFVSVYTLIVVLLNDALMLSGLVRFRDGSHEVYLVGTKFTVAYMHMNLLALWIVERQINMQKKRIPKYMLIIAAAFLVLISWRVQCITGIIGCLALFLCLLVTDVRNKGRLDKLASPVILLAALLINLIFPFVSDAIVTIPAVEYFIVEILGRNLSLTGRTNIFNMFGQQMAGHWLLGYGYGNGNAAAMALFGYANAQNSLLHWILQAGCLTTGALSLWMMQIFRQLTKSSRFSFCLPLVLLIYVYILLGAVETTFSTSFLLWVAMIFMMVNENQQTQL